MEALERAYGPGNRLLREPLLPFTAALESSEIAIGGLELARSVKTC